jgi:hypothetical protein
MAADEWMTSYPAAGAQAIVGDVAQVFIGREAIDARLRAIRETPERDHDRVGLLLRSPVRAAGADGNDSTSVIGADLSAAAHHIDMVMASIERHISTHAAMADRRITLSAELRDNVEAVGPLAQRLGLLGTSAAELTERAEQVLGQPFDDDPVVRLAALEGCAGELADVVGTLRTADRERTAVLQQLASARSKLETLRLRADRVAVLADECREKIADAPNLAVPDPTVLAGQLSDVTDMVDYPERHPWPSVRARAVPLLARIDRLDTSLDEATRRFAEPIDSRDRMRGLLQAFRDKAAAGGRGEDPSIERLYRVAESLLWTAPCNLDESSAAVDAYIQLVNGVVSAPTGQGRR